MFRETCMNIVFLINIFASKCKILNLSEWWKLNEIYWRGRIQTSVWMRAKNEKKKWMYIYIVVSSTKYFLLCYSEEAISLIQWTIKQNCIKIDMRLKLTCADPEHFFAGEGGGPRIIVFARGGPRHICNKFTM